MADVKIEVTEDNSDKVIAAMHDALDTALEAVGIQAENYAKLLAPVDTGLLRNSITHAVAGKAPAISSYETNDLHAITKATKNAGTAGKPVSKKVRGSYSGATDGKDVVYVGTNVEYAPYVEYGTKRNEAQPFLRPAIEKHMDEYKRIFETYLRGNNA